MYTDLKKTLAAIGRCLPDEGELTHAGCSDIYWGSELDSVFNIFSYRLIIGPPDFCFPASTMSNAGFKINAKRSWIYLL